MAQNDRNVFRQKTIVRVSSPEQLTDYLRVTNPGIWVILAAVILLLAGILTWSVIGTLETTADAYVVVEDHAALVVCNGAQAPSAGMLLRISGQEVPIAATRTDQSGRTVGLAEIEMPDGVYDGTLVVERTHPIAFLLTNNQ